MKKSLLSASALTAVGLFSVFGLTSCGILQSAATIPGSILKTVGRTAGMNIDHQEEPAQKPQIDIAEGHIDQLD